MAPKRKPTTPAATRSKGKPPASADGRVVSSSVGATTDSANAAPAQAATASDAGFVLLRSTVRDAALTAVNDAGPQWCGPFGAAFRRLLMRVLTRSDPVSDAAAPSDGSKFSPLLIPPIAEIVLSFIPFAIRFVVPQANFGRPRLTRVVWSSRAEWLKWRSDTPVYSDDTRLASSDTNLMHMPFSDCMIEFGDASTAESFPPRNQPPPAPEPLPAGARGEWNERILPAIPCAVSHAPELDVTQCAAVWVGMEFDLMSRADTGDTAGVPYDWNDHPNTVIGILPIEAVYSNYSDSGFNTFARRTELGGALFLSNGTAHTRFFAHFRPLIAMYVLARPMSRKRGGWR